MYTNQRDNPKFADQITTIVKLLKSDKQRDDIEAILSVLSIKTDNTNTNTMHYLASSHDLLSELDVSTVREIIDDIIKYIYEKCREPNFDKAIQIYRKLYDESEVVELFRLKQGPRRERINYLINKNIFTTNYDLIIESFLKVVKLDITMGSKQMNLIIQYLLVVGIKTN